ncbi:MAG: SPFH domain / Band 7 family protein [Actinobacteria bacterium ADurb.BinA094]|nr:MAG: SPFH domain / Band 7 family protein [Actinobacteria bacterium ADurb.BinA094]
MPADQKTPTQEREKRVMSGWPMLAVTVALYTLCPVLIALAFVWGTTGAEGAAEPVWSLFAGGVVAGVVAGLLSPGFFTIQPNEARVLILFGDYKGTCRQVGFRWGNPFYANGPAGQSTGSQTQWPWGKKSEDAQGQTGAKRLRRYKVSLRARTLNGERLKVNDKRGNPVDIAAVVVWRVDDTAKAVFDVDDFESYVAMQSETAVRHLASAYPYDSGETSADSDDEVTLRGNVDDVSEALRVELTERLAQAGVVVEQARLSHLAYSPEIAQAMLRRQQAEAIIAARRKIVTGAVSMVEMALAEFHEHRTIDFDEERKAAMVSNPMVVLCGESQVAPVVNTGTLYQ